MRGPGDGRRVASVQPLTLSNGLIRVRPNGAIVSLERKLDLDDDERRALPPPDPTYLRAAL